MSRTVMKTLHPSIGLRLTNWLLAAGLLLVGQAAQAAIPLGYSVIDTISYEYDAEGNRIARSATVSGIPETPIEAQYDQGNRLTRLTLKGQGQNGTDRSCTLSYDLNGNLAGKSCIDPANSTPITTQYIWDSRNRLTQIQSPSVTASFQYDPLGRRVERTVNGHTTHYLYDGSQTIVELSDSGNTSYLTGLAIDEVIAQYTTQGERTLLTDALGSVLIAAKEDTSVATAYGYSAYGETQVMGTDEQNPIQYTSRENDGNGLYYYRARYYDPQLKRFISVDPIGIEGGINVYAYVEGDPLSFTDPMGLHKGDKWYGYNNREFQRWFHKCWKQAGNADADKEEIAEAYAEWISRGSPTGGNCDSTPPPPPAPAGSCGETCQMTWKAIRNAAGVILFWIAVSVCTPG